jgi:riboflavin biosynthesis pyrimidine reductase
MTDREPRLVDAAAASSFDDCVAAHVALPRELPTDRAFIRCNMIESADGASSIEGRSGALGNRSDHTVFGALRAHADAIVVGMGTVIAERYGPPARPDLAVYVVANRPAVPNGIPLFDQHAATLVLTTDAGDPPGDVPVVRAGHGRNPDIAELCGTLPGKVLNAEGGPTLAGAMVARGLVDELFVTIAPRALSGGAGRILRGPEASSDPWTLVHGFCDDEGFLFLRYARG